jgi:cytosine/creatinine deaminase
MHPDKTLMGQMAHMAGPTRMSRIETDKRVLPHLPVSTEERAGNLIEACVARGTAHLRTHVDIDLESRLLKLDGVLAACERHRGRASVRPEVARFSYSPFSNGTAGRTPFRLAVPVY